MQNQKVTHIAFWGTLLSWVILLTLGMVEQYYEVHRLVIPYNPSAVKGAVLNFYIIGAYVFTNQIRKKREDTDFYLYIWEVFIVAVVCTFFSILISFFLFLIDHTELANDVLLHSFFFHIEFGLFMVFLMVAFTSWKKMILHKKSNFTHYTWLLFEGGLFATMILHYFRLGNIEDLYHNVPYLVFFVLIVLVCTNLKWIPQLTFNQKVMTLIHTLIIMVCMTYYLTQITQYFRNEPLVVDDLTKSLFSTVLFSFIMLYAIAMILVLLFNLPTSSVFEEKFKEIAVFQKLSETLADKKDEREVYAVLLESAVTSVKAEAGWIEVPDSKVFFQQGEITEEEIVEVKNKLEDLHYDGTKIKRHSNKLLFQGAESQTFNSYLVIPIDHPGGNKGSLVLLGHLNNTFDHMMTRLVKTFIDQAGIAVHNYRLINQAVENERYKGELEIARQVHDRLLPKRLISNENFELHGFSQSATEVGGDYYDLHQINKNEYAVIIADVAGNGIPAAFNMAQMKGIFHSLVRMEFSPDSFLKYANSALSSCLERTSFITATYFHINIEKQEVYYSRAGHCPTLFYTHKDKKAKYIESKGLGLGIIRSAAYEKFTGVDSFKYEKGDMMLLYTDGVVEAENKDLHDQYGYNRLRDSFEKNQTLPINDIIGAVLKDIHVYTGSEHIGDDYTLLLIRF